jgi:hypothetical protein
VLLIIDPVFFFIDFLDCKLFAATFRDEADDREKEARVANCPS